MSQNWYQIEHLEGTEWVIKCRTDFEDTEQFTEIAKNPSYRIIHEDKDVTKKYNKQYVKIPEVVKRDHNIIPETPEITPIKPAAFKALSESEQSKIVKKAYEMRNQSYRRSDIMTTLNVTESTYDIIVKAVSALSSEDKVDETVKRTDAPVHTLKRGLFANR